MMKRLMMMVATFFVGLAYGEIPDAFVEYVESTDKNTYIDTGIFVNPKSTKVMIDLALTDVGSSQNLFGCYGGNNATQRSYVQMSGGVLYPYWAGVNSAGPRPAIGERLSIFLQDTFVTINGGWYGKSTTSRVATPVSQPFFLFTRCENNSSAANSNGAKMRLYGCKIFLDGETLSASYVPCVKNGVAGLYDMVTGTILYPERGELLASEEANQEVRIEGGAVQVALTVTSTEEGGTCADGGKRWVSVGGSIELSAVPSEGMLTIWETPIDNQPTMRRVAGDGYAFTMPAHGVEIGVSFASDIYLPKVSNVAEYVAAAEEGAELMLDEGTYYIDREIVIEKELTLRGQGRDKTFIKPELSVQTRGINMKSAGSIVEDVTIAGFTNVLKEAGSGVRMENGKLNRVRVTGNQCYSYHLKAGAGIYMSGGVVTNSIIENNSAESGYGGVEGIGICMTKGLVVDCVITNNWRDRNEFKGGGVCIGGAGTLQRCLVMGNGSKNKGNNTANTRGMGVYLKSAGAVVDQCLIISNDIHGVLLENGTVKNSVIMGHETTSAAYTAGVEMKGGNLWNCTITENQSPNTFAGLKMTGGTSVNNIVYGNGELGDVSATSGTFHTNLVSGLSGVTTMKAVGNIVSDPFFQNLEEGDFSIGFNSPALDAGATIAAVSQDLAGVERPQGAGHDIGAYEWVAAAGGELACAIIVSQTRVMEGEAVSIRARVQGGTGTYTYTWYVDGQLREETGDTPSFENLEPGAHSVRLVVSDGESVQEAVTENPIEICPLVVYVSKNGSNSFPYNTEAKAAQSVNDAFAALWKASDIVSVINIGEGEYILSAELACTTPIQILGAGRDLTILDGSELGYAFRAIDVAEDGVVVKDLTICKCKNNVGGTAIRMERDGWLESIRVTENCVRNPDGGSQLGGSAGIYMSAGVVTNCLVDANWADSSYGGFDGVGIRMSGGLVVDSTICDNWRRRGQVLGVGVSVRGGTLLRCMIKGNHNFNIAPDADDTQGMGLYVAGNGAVVQNCSVISNGFSGIRIDSGSIYNTLVSGHQKLGSNKTTAGVWQRGGNLYNCTIAGNVSLNELNSDLVRIGGNLVNCIVVKTETEAGENDKSNLLAVDPKFKNSGKGDYHLRQTSPAINAGDNTVWEDFDHPTDLDGNNRLGVESDGKVDIGCYERMPSRRTLLEVM